MQRKEGDDAVETLPSQSSLTCVIQTPIPLLVLSQ